MPDIPHKNLTGLDLHEPKGADVATTKQVYLSDGSGSGTWTSWPTGWGFYQDSKVSPNTQSIGTTPTVLINDGGGLSETSYLPISMRSGGSFWDPIGNKLTPDLVGDMLQVRISLMYVAKSGTPTELNMFFDVGGTGGAPTQVLVEDRKTISKTPPYMVVYDFQVPVLSDFKTKGGQIYLQTDVGSITINKASVLVTRTHGASY